MQIKKQFRSFDLFVLTYSSMITLGIAFLPYVAEEEIRSAWLKLLVSSLPYFLLLWLLYLFTKKYTDYDFYGAVQQSMWRGFFLVIIFYIIGSSLYSGVILTEGLYLITTTYLLPTTPKWLIIGSYFVIAGIGVSYGIMAITRFLVILAGLEMLAFIAIFFLGFGEYFSWMYIPPILDVSLPTFLRSSVSDMAKYGGIIAVFAYIAFMKQDEPIWKPLNLGLAFVVILYVAISIVVLGTFGFEQAFHLISPITALIQSTPTRTGFMERLDLFFLAFWVLAFYKMKIIHLWMVTYLAKKCFSEVPKAIFIWLFLLLMYLLVFLTPDILHGEWRLHNINFILYSFVLPFLLLLYLLLKKKTKVS